MPTLSEINAKVLVHLLREAGTTSYWTSTEVDVIINFIYKDLARQYRNIKKEDTSLTSGTTAGTVYDYPSGLMAIEEVLFNDIGIDPISIYEIRMMDDQWRTRTGVPDWYCLDYLPNKILLWYFATEAKTIKLLGPTIPDDLTANITPERPYADGMILEAGTVSFCLTKEGPGQNLERAAWWWDICVGFLKELDKPAAISMDHVLRSIDNPRNIKFGPRLPSNYPRYPWR